jgi:hypothetical protein
MCEVIDPSVSFFAVDLFIAKPGETEDDAYKFLIDNMVQYKFYPRIICGTSEQAAQHFQTGS